MHFPQLTINYLIQTLLPIFQLKSEFYLKLKDEPHTEATIIGLYDVLFITTRIMRAGKRLHTVSYILSQIDKGLLHDILYVRKVKYTYIFWYSACLKFNLTPILMYVYGICSCV